LIYQSKRLLLFTRFLVFSMFFGFFVGYAYAHSPHDVVESVAISPGYEKDQTLFIYVFDELKKSTDGGYTWQVLENGLDNTSSLISDISTSSGNVANYQVFVATQGDGIYRSGDRGKSWRSVNTGLINRNIHRLALSPDFDNDQTLVAIPHGTGIFVSTNAGDSWRQISQDQFSASSVTIIKENDKTRLLAGTQNGDLYLSGDEFENWTKQGAIEGAGEILDLSQQVMEGGKRVIFVGAELGGLYKTYNLGKSAIHISMPIDGKNKQKASYVTSVTATENSLGSADVFVTRWQDALFYSSNGGDNWKVLGNGLKKDRQADEYKVAHFYEASIPPEFARHGDAFTAGFAGFFKTTDGGQSWTEMETRQARNIEGLALSPSFSSDHTIALASYDGGAYVSRDSGKTWTTQNFGLPSTHLWDIAIAKDDKNGLLIYAISNPGFLALKGNSAVWSLNQLATTKYWKYVTANFSVDSFVTKIARRVLGYPEQSYPTQIAVSKNFSSDKTLFLGTRYKGVLKSTDGGSTWAHPWSADDGWVSSLKISPDFSTDKAVFSAVRKKGFYLSTDGGDTWQLRNSGLSTLAVNYEQLGTSIIELSPEFSTDQKIYFGTADGLYLSTNRGQQWERLRVTDNEQQEMIRGIGISPDFSTDGTIFVSVKGRGLYQSIDYGASFSPIAPGLIQNQKVLKLFRFSSDYATDHTVFAASAEDLYVSRDSGISWTRIERPIRYENTKDNITYHGAWEKSYNAKSSALSLHRSNVPGDKAEFYFYGTQVVWYGPKSSEYGIAKVYIDGNLIGKAEQFGSALEDFVPVFTVDKLPLGKHTLTIEVDNDESGNATSRYIAIDALEVL
jgi:photosystem II stability/assembly factor-like uncharacterized protein